jgi:hypothetical protein
MRVAKHLLPLALRPVEAVSTHYMALGRAAAGRACRSSPVHPLRIPGTIDMLTAGGRLCDRPVALGLHGGRFRVREQGFSLRCWYGSRTRHSQINGLVLFPLS